MFGITCVNMFVVMYIDIPVLVIAFNRPDHTRRLLQRLASQGVGQIYVSIDGPRNIMEVAKCEEVLAVAKTFSDKMEIIVLHRSYNLGCGLGVTAALDWFFTRVNFGIILEDDCLPEDGFFEYFEDFFSKIFDYEIRGVSMASAHNPFQTYGSDVVSSYYLIQGWGTTRGNWEEVRRGFFRLGSPHFSNNTRETRSLSEGVYWWANATRARVGSVDTWDSMFCDRMWTLGKKCLIPSTNLIQNNGFGEAATHTKDPAGSILMDLDADIKGSMDFDYLLRHYYFNIRAKHAITPLLKVMRDYSLLLFHSRIEKSLERDSNLRTETRLS
jgi:hypothetical protein